MQTLECRNYAESAFDPWEQFKCNICGSLAEYNSTSCIKAPEMCEECDAKIKEIENEQRAMA